MSNDPAAGAIQVHLNGEPKLVPAGQTAADLVAQLGLSPQATLLELNERALLRSEWRETTLANGDRIEILRVAAGG